MEKELSARIEILRFPLIIGIVFIHSYSTNVQMSDVNIGIDGVSSFPHFIMYYISNVIARISVPIFFILSGFLFFYNFHGDMTSFIKKFTSRIYTLLIPFLFWNIFVLILYTIAQNIPLTANFFSGNNLISSYNLTDFINAIFGVNRLPLAYQFWFIRDLMIIIVFSPVIYFCLKYFSYLILVLLFFSWLLNFWPVMVPSEEAVMFFYLGAFISLKKYDVFILDNYRVVLLFSYIVLSMLDYLTYGMHYHFILHKIGLIFGIAVMINLTKNIFHTKNLKKRTIAMGSASFFIFAAHEPLLTILRKLLYKFIHPENDITILILYFSVPIATIILCYFTYILLKKEFSKVLSWISGGR